MEPKAQLVLVTNTSASDGDNDALSNREDNSGERHNETHEASDILMAPRILENDTTSGIRALGGIPLKPIQQAVILAQCLLIEKSARHDEMQSKLPAPFFFFLIYLFICFFLSGGGEGRRIGSSNAFND